MNLLKLSSAAALVVMASEVSAGVNGWGYSLTQADQSTYKSMVQLPDCNYDDSIKAYLANEVYYGKHFQHDSTKVFAGGFAYTKPQKDYGMWRLNCDSSKPMINKSTGLPDPSIPFPLIICAPPQLIIDGGYDDYQDRAMLCVKREPCKKKPINIKIGRKDLNAAAAGLDKPKADLLGFKTGGTSRFPKVFGPDYISDTPEGTDGVIGVKPVFKTPGYLDPANFDPLGVSGEELNGDHVNVGKPLAEAGDSTLQALYDGTLEVIDTASFFTGEDDGTIDYPEFGSTEQCIEHWILQGWSLDMAYLACGKNSKVGLDVADAALMAKEFPELQGSDITWEYNPDITGEQNAYKNWVASTWASFFWSLCGERWMIFTGTDDENDYVYNKSTSSEYWHGYNFHKYWFRETTNWDAYLEMNLIKPKFDYTGQLMGIPQVSQCPTVKNPYKISFIGHSLGGAIASIAAARYIEQVALFPNNGNCPAAEPDYENYIKIETFGQPPHLGDNDCHDGKPCPYLNFDKITQYVASMLHCVDGKEKKTADRVPNVMQPVNPWEHHSKAKYVQVTSDHRHNSPNWNGCRPRAYPYDLFGYPNDSRFTNPAFGWDYDNDYLWFDEADEYSALQHYISDVYLPGITIGHQNIMAAKWHYNKILGTCSSTNALQAFEITCAHCEDNECKSWY